MGEFVVLGESPEPGPAADEGEEGEDEAAAAPAPRAPPLPAEVVDAAYAEFERAHAGAAPPSERAAIEALHASVGVQLAAALAVRPPPAAPAISRHRQNRHCLLPPLRHPPCSPPPPCP